MLASHFTVHIAQLPGLAVLASPYPPTKTSLVPISTGLIALQLQAMTLAASFIHGTQSRRLMVHQ